MEDKIKELRAKAMSLPLSPGVYIMRDKNKKIIYIGKAKMLKNRVSQYFGSHTNHTPKVIKMVENVDTFDYIVTDSEFEALVLECSLIKQNSPHYNILLKDDKGYNYIKITNEQWPRIKAVNKIEKDNAQYIGPYMSGYYVKNAVDQAVRIFRLPTCNRKFPQEIGKGRPCLNYHIKLCNAPCKGNITNKEYCETIKEAVEFLKGGNSLDIKKMTEEMNIASENLEFERAAKIRDRINAVKKMAESQKVVCSKIAEQDVIAGVTEGDRVCFEVFRFKNSALYDREHFIINNVDDLPQTRSEFISSYYYMRNTIPPRITVDGDVNDSELLQQWLSKKLGKKVTIVKPQKGEQLQLVEMCKKNAAEHLAHQRGAQGKDTMALNALGELLGLDSTPSYIESYDISNQNGTANVAGMVVFEDGKPLKSAYRKFEIKTIVGQDDYGSMAEVISRRLDEYEKHKDEGIGFGRLPDLILLDGGKGQVNAVMSVMKAKGYNIPLFGMVKDNKHRTRAITDAGKEISISNKRNVFTLVSTIQEEVHRFAIGYHRQKRKATAFKSSLTEIDGVGEKRAKALLKHFGTISNIKEADLAELEQAPTMNSVVARMVFKYFHSGENQ
ncbi:MAG: excinuclease ABC subunit UvrC [Acutalibacteraceae bacterium]|nr:excinuclease ABC subunit UvrC [Acutalibacteraceae bacterium]